MKKHVTPLTSDHMSKVAEEVPAEVPEACKGGPSGARMWPMRGSIGAIEKAWAQGHRRTADGAGGEQRRAAIARGGMADEVETVWLLGPLAVAGLTNAAARLCPCPTSGRAAEEVVQAAYRG